MAKKKVAKKVTRKSKLTARKPTKVKKQDPVKPGDREFRKKIDVPKPSRAQKKAREAASVCTTKTDNRTAIMLRRNESHVTLIPYSQGGLAVDRMTVADFDRAYRPLSDYPIGRAVRLYIGFSEYVGATDEAVEEFKNLCDLLPGEEASAREALAKNKCPRTVIKEIPAGKHGVVKMKKQSKPGNTAASMLKSLIMEGGRTKEEIFKKVQDVFGLSDNKISYVKWYWNRLKKEGMNPPELKPSEKKSKKTEDKKPKKAPAKKAVAKKTATKKKEKKKVVTNKKATKKAKK